ncbi:ionotropic receptor 40a [Drosophila ficusphila]|uniref:ionotropic receptor 40a n=1 Tax=Drosophila ficusphila TaxID=30025 RepID=UPI001C895CA1|nr:ionotropic receptor 40a [Drosophila ficusphila]
MRTFLVALLLPLALLCNLNATRLTFHTCNESSISIALSQIIRDLQPLPLVILVGPDSDLTDAHCKNDRGVHLDTFLQRLNRLHYQLVIFSDTGLFFQHIEKNLQGAKECVSLILDEPKKLIKGLRERRLAHRLSLFIFYWGACWPPSARTINFTEPLRAVVITRPRQKAFRIYYNQARPSSVSQLQLVNWYDDDNLGLHRSPLLPTALSVYANFNGRVFRVPVFHSPPWFWVTYCNNSKEEYDATMAINGTDCNEMHVTGGRDHRLLLLLAQHMNFKFNYIEAPGRTQGSMKLDYAKELNDNFTGGIGMLQNGQADFFLGDVGLSLERRRAIEFSFFTLADSGAFATHAPRRLNEAFAIMRPFKLDIWPYLILTIVFSGPIFYGIIALPYIWRQRSVSQDLEDIGNKNFYLAYIKEISPLLLKFNQRKVFPKQQMPRKLFEKCIWFVIRLFLKQSCHELYNGYRAKFLTIVYWIAATYVLADIYSAQLTSQFARPAHEPPINTLQRLQAAMIRDGYRLYVEKESSSLEMLENGTELFRQLYALMRHQQSGGQQGFLIDSVEAGIQLIDEGGEDKAVLGGRETLYFNTQQYGANNFQLSQKLYTRYSAVAVQIGCPFLESLNDVLIHLFEGGILEKMTTAEYVVQSRKRPKSNTQHTKELSTTENVKAGIHSKNIEIQSRIHKRDVIGPLNLRMLQGAFIALGVGALSAGLILLLELLFQKLTYTEKLWSLCSQIEFLHFVKCFLYSRKVFRERFNGVKSCRPSRIGQTVKGRGNFLLKEFPSLRACTEYVITFLNDSEKKRFWQQ